MHTVELRNTLPLCSGGRQRVDLCESVSPQPGAAPGHMHRGKPRRVLEDDDDPSSDEMPGADSFEPSDASVDEFDPPPELAEWARQLLKRLTGTLGAWKKGQALNDADKETFQEIAALLGDLAKKDDAATEATVAWLQDQGPTPGAISSLQEQRRGGPRPTGLRKLARMNSAQRLAYFQS